jgi:hypothetical protein
VEALRVARGWGSHIFRHSAHRWRQVWQPYAPAAFYTQEESLYSFLLEAESTPRAIVRLEGLGKLKKSTSSGTRSGAFPACSIVPQPTTLPRAPVKYKAHGNIWAYFTNAFLIHCTSYYSWFSHIADMNLFLQSSTHYTRHNVLVNNNIICREIHAS